MPDLTYRTTQVMCILDYDEKQNKRQLLNDLIKYLSLSGFKYATINHTKDIYDETDTPSPDKIGAPKTYHTHLIIEAPTTHQLQYYLNRVADQGFKLNQISVRPIASLPLAFQYLTHKNDPKKAQYGRKLVISNYSAEKQDELFNTECINDICFDTLKTIVENSLSLTEVASKIGVKAFKENYHLLKTMKDEGYLNKANRRKHLLKEYGIHEKE